MQTKHPSPADQDPALWDAKDVAAYLKASRSWVYQRAEAGQLPCLRIGGLLRFDPAMIRAHARGEQPVQASVIPFIPRRKG
ncbi:MAG: helix-turn-helix domain-containing protein [Polyangiaceae bacterium]|nr:helix-turn-helix domain-containing protein [Polyangiaceae bacterium]